MFQVEYRLFLEDVLPRINLSNILPILKILNRGHRIPIALENSVHLEFTLGSPLIETQYRNFSSRFELYEISMAH